MSVTRRRMFGRGKHTQGRGLAGAVRSDESPYLPVGQGEGEIADGDQVVKQFRETLNANFHQ